MNYKRIYVAATSQHVGKTTSTLGLISALRSQGLNVGYCKPVGQQFIEVAEGRADKDAVLFAQYMGFELQPSIHSPVILGKGTTKEYLGNPEKFMFKDKVIKASKILDKQHDVVVYEGTGHPGVGSVVDLSNADVAKTLDAGVIMVVEGGIGNTIDRLKMSIAIFEQQDVPIIGVIINKVHKTKMDEVSNFVGLKLEQMGLPLLGVIPYEPELELPLMIGILNAVKGKVLYNEDKLDNRIEDIIAGSLIDLEDLKSSENLLLIVSVKRLGDALKRLEKVAKRTGEKNLHISGIIVTGHSEIDQAHIDFFEKEEIPVIITELDTYESVVKISRMEVKINTRTPWKIVKAVALFRQHINLDPIISKVLTH